MNDSVNDLIELISSKAWDSSVNGWRLTKDFHMTCHFFGKKKEEFERSKIDLDVFMQIKKQKISVRALVLVPGKILTAICFPTLD
jgi:hypothetical protein